MGLMSMELYFLQFIAIFIFLTFLVKKLTSSKKEKDLDHVACIHSFSMARSLLKSKLGRETPLEALGNVKKDKTILTGFFPVRFILVRDYEIAKEISSSDNFSDRPIGAVFSGRCAGAPRGMLQNNGPSWKEVRSFTVKKLVQLGFGKKGKMTLYIEGELEDVLDHVMDLSIATRNQIPVQDLFANSVLNIVWRMTAGEKFARDDPEYLKVKYYTVTATSLSHGKMLSYQCLPLRCIIRMAPGLFGFKEILDSSDNLRNYFVNYVVRRQQLGKHKTCAEDFIDGFLQEIDKYSESEDEYLKNIYCVDELAGIIMDLFEAGIDTTNNTLEGAMMLMIKNPHVQKKVQEEIDLVVGASRFPSYYEDRNKMPYTWAVILEISRMVSIVPISARTAKNDCQVGGLNVKKGTMAFMQLYSIRMNATFWGDPNEFRPERFLDSDNNIVSSKVSHVFAFGGGMRVCPGEAVATATIFAFLTGMLQRYTLSKIQKNEKLEMTGSDSITNSALPFHMSVKLRR